IDNEVARIMRDAHDCAYQILSEKRDQIDLMASVLLERETIEGDACEALLNNTWSDYLKYEQSEEGQAAKRAAESTIVEGYEPPAPPVDPAAEAAAADGTAAAQAAPAPQADDAAQKKEDK
ncbi:MAG: cell division protein FtsH, partial [Raoultibacter sp.]